MLRPHLVRRVCRAGKARRTGGAQGDTRGGGSAATRTSFRDPGPFLRPRPGRDAPCSRNAPEPLSAPPGGPRRHAAVGARRPHQEEAGREAGQRWRRAEAASGGGRAGGGTEMAGSGGRTRACLPACPVRRLVCRRPEWSSPRTPRRRLGQAPGPRHCAQSPSRAWRPRPRRRVQAPPGPLGTLSESHTPRHPRLCSPRPLVAAFRNCHSATDPLT